MSSATSAAARRRVAPNVIRVRLPITSQATDYSCGAAALQAICLYYGVGPRDEAEYVKALGMDRRVGSHPHQIVDLARRLGLRVREFWPMSMAQLIHQLDLGHPVMLMIQAWGEERVGGSWRPRSTYDGVWSDGHWVVAVGYDADSIIFVDPSLDGELGYLPLDELQSRWRDTGPRGRHMERYGVAIWAQRTVSRAGNGFQPTSTVRIR